MALIEWGKSYELGVKEIDAQHRELVRMTNELHDAMRAGKGSEALEQLFAKLVAYTVSHFATEERMMRSNGYFDAPSHFIEHDKLRRTATELQQALATGKAPLTIDVMTFLRDWLTKHILGTDRKLAQWLIAREAAKRSATAVH